MRDMFDFVIVDCGHHLDENSVAACERSNSLIYVLNQSVTSVRSAWRFIDLFERLSLAVEPHFALNRFQPAHSITQKHLENTLGHPMYVTLPRDDKSLELAELSGKDLWQVAATSRAGEELRGPWRAGSPTSKRAEEREQTIHSPAVLGFQRARMR